MAGLAVELAIAEARRALDEQVAALADARQRVGFIIGGGGLGSSFLASSALREHEGAPLLAIVALVLLVAATYAATTVLRPRQMFRSAANPDALAGPAWSDLPDDEVARVYAEYAGVVVRARDDSLNDVWRGVRWTMALTSASLVAWVLLLVKGP